MSCKPGGGGGCQPAAAADVGSYDGNLLIASGEGDAIEEDAQSYHSYDEHDDDEGVGLIPPLSSSLTASAAGAGADTTGDVSWSCGLPMSSSDLSDPSPAQRRRVDDGPGTVPGRHHRDHRTPNPQGDGDGDGNDDGVKGNAGNNARAPPSAASADQRRRDNPATAAADEAAALSSGSVASLSVDAITGLIANADHPTTREYRHVREETQQRPQQQERQPRPPQQQEQQQQPIPPPPPPQPNAAAIVRSIASYLSFSDAESIGSLALTPFTPGGGGGGGGGAYRFMGGTPVVGEYGHGHGGRPSPSPSSIRSAVSGGGSRRRTAASPRHHRPGFAAPPSAPSDDASASGSRSRLGGRASASSDGVDHRHHRDDGDEGLLSLSSAASSDDSSTHDDADAAAGGMTPRRVRRGGGGGTPWTSGGGTATTTSTTNASANAGATAGRTPRGLLRSAGGTCGSYQSAGGESGMVSWAADHRNNDDDNNDEEEEDGGGTSTTTPPAPGLISLGEEEDDDDGEEGAAWGEGGDDDELMKSADEEKNLAEGGVDGDGASAMQQMDEESLNLYRRRHRQFVQRKLTAAVLSHPQSVRSYCLDAHRTALEMQRAREEKAREEQMQIEAATAAAAAADGTIPSSSSPELLTERRAASAAAHHRRRRKEQQQRIRILRTLASKILNNVPLSVLLDVSESIFETSLDTTLATFKLATMTVENTVSILATLVGRSFEVLASLNPFALLGAILTFQRDAACHATDALVSGIQSVATGVGSAGTAATAAAIHALSRGGGDGSGFLSGERGHHGNNSNNVAAAAHHGSSRGKGGHHQGGIADQAQFGSASRFLSKMNLLRSANSSINQNVISEKMYRKLSKVDSTSKVLSYVEREDEVLTQHAKKRVQRMMHYHVSLRPFVATVVTVPAEKKQAKPPRQYQAGGLHPDASFQSIDFPNSDQTQLTSRGGVDNPPPSPERQEDQGKQRVDAESSSLSSNDSEPFMCTPKSFPPTPTSRSHVMARGTRFAEDVVFLARDQLRVRDGLESDNAQTRAMAKALKEGSRLAVFNASDAGGGIALTCGQHCATKVGNDLYCSTRSMIPILRNCYVYFEMSVSTPPAPSMMHQHASISVGLSTLEMPLNTLVGAWKGSVGLCTTGQILAAGQWCSPLDPRLSAYGTNSTVGCLICLDDDSAFETWDGVMVTAVVTFNVNGNVVTPPVCAPPIGVAGGTGFAATTQSFVGAGGATWDGQTSSDAAGQQQLQSPPHASTMPLFVPREEELFPTLTLHSPETQVLCRFCAQDVLAKSRREIGAPAGVTIFAVDGSVLLDEDEDELELYQGETDDQGVGGSDDMLECLAADEKLQHIQSTFIEK